MTDTIKDSTSPLFNFEESPRLSSKQLQDITISVLNASVDDPICYRTFHEFLLQIVQLSKQFAVKDEDTEEIIPCDMAMSNYESVAIYHNIISMFFIYSLTGPAANPNGYANVQAQLTENLKTIRTFFLAQAADSFDLAVKHCETWASMLQEVEDAGMDWPSPNQGPDTKH